MTTEQPTARRPGPHAPLPGVAAAVASGIAASPAPAAVEPAAEIDHRARAAARAQELRDHGASDDEADEFYIDPRIVPDGWTYEWKRLEVLGQPDPSYQVTLAGKGWEAVPVTRHPELMPAGWAGNTILRKGQILMERPTEINNEARAREHRAARDQVRGKEQQLGAAPTGTFERNNSGTQMASVKKNLETIPIPKE